jgi:hypothetical protein
MVVSSIKGIVLGIKELERFLGTNSPNLEA